LLVNDASTTPALPVRQCKRPAGVQADSAAVTGDDKETKRARPTAGKVSPDDHILHSQPAPQPKHTSAAATDLPAPAAGASTPGDANSNTSLVAGGGESAQQQQQQQQQQQRHHHQLQLQGGQQHAPQQQQQQPSQPATCAHLGSALHGSNNSELLTAAIRFLLAAHERSRARTVLGGLPNQDLKAFLEQRMPFLKAALEDGDQQGARELLQTWVELAQQ
jgi:hypothetical protein